MTEGIKGGALWGGIIKVNISKSKNFKTSVTLGHYGFIVYCKIGRVQLPEAALVYLNLHTLDFCKQYVVHTIDIKQS